MNKRYKILFGLLFLSLVLLCGCGGDSGKLPTGTAPETEPTDESQETPAPEDSSPEGESEPIYITFEGTDLKGNPVSQEIFSQSKLTMVNVWATYCNPCPNEMPGLGELAAEHDGKIYRGRLKYACVPGLNCYSCPGAIAFCPIWGLTSAAEPVRFPGPLRRPGVFLCVRKPAGALRLRLAVPLRAGAGPSP